MPLAPPLSCVEDPGSSLCAADVVRGVTRMLLRHDLVAVPEMPLDGGRRVDLMAVDPRGVITVVEIKVSRADLIGDGKWTDYLAWCDRFFWAVPAGFDTSLLEREIFLPERAGLIVADRYDAAVLREPSTVALAPALRRKLHLGLARRAGRRLIARTDPDAEVGDGWRAPS